MSGIIFLIFFTKIKSKKNPLIFASRVLGTTNFLRKKRFRPRKREREKVFLSPGTRSRKFQRRILLTFQAAGRRRRRLKRNPCADGKLLEIIASAETSQTLNESRAFGLSNGTRITHDVYMKDVGLRSTCTRFENFTIERGRRKGRREEERRSTKCEITGIGRET